MTKGKKILGITAIIAVIGIIILYSFNVQKNEQKGQKVDYLKVEFHKILDIDKSLEYQQRMLAKPKSEWGDNPYKKYVGVAEYKNGKVTINVSDPKLEKTLTSPFGTERGKQEGDMFITEYVALEPGTLDHLIAVAQELQGYTAITTHKEPKRGK